DGHGGERSGVGHHRTLGGSRHRGRADERGGRSRRDAGGHALHAKLQSARLHFDLGEAELVQNRREAACEVHNPFIPSRDRRCTARLAHQLAAATRPRYSPVRVSTFTTSPSFRKSGTWTTAPVSSVAGFVPPSAVSPRIPGSVLTICSSMKLGSSTETGLSLMNRISTSVFSLRKSRASPTSSAESEIWS